MSLSQEKREAIQEDVKSNLKTFGKHYLSAYKVQLSVLFPSLSFLFLSSIGSVSRVCNTMNGGKMKEKERGRVKETEENEGR
jgi:hypothetical protein